MYFEVANSEGERTEYTVVLVRETVAREGGETVVGSATVADRRDVAVGSGDSQLFEYDPDPAAGDSAVRLRAYLYRGDAPAEPSESSAYRTLQVWFDDSPFETAG